MIFNGWQLLETGNFTPSLRFQYVLMIMPPIFDLDNQGLCIFLNNCVIDLNMTPPSARGMFLQEQRCVKKKTE